MSIQSERPEEISKHSEATLPIFAKRRGQPRCQPFSQSRNNCVSQTSAACGARCRRLSLFETSPIKQRESQLNSYAVTSRAKTFVYNLGRMTKDLSKTSGSPRPGSVSFKRTRPQHQTFFRLWYRAPLRNISTSEKAGTESTFVYSGDSDSGLLNVLFSSLGSYQISRTPVTNIFEGL
jgi:hypothetical protein